MSFYKRLKDFNKSVDFGVFYGSLVCVFLLLSATLFFEDRLLAAVHLVKSFLISGLGFVYCVSLVVIIVFLFYIYFKFGHIKIGGEGAKKDFSDLSWFSMLFSAGIGTGLMYSGAFEPLSHYFFAPQFQGLEETQKFIASLSLTYFHWAFPAWCIYAAAALVFAVSGFNFNLGFQYSNLFPDKYKKLKLGLNVFAVLSILTGVVATFVIASEQLDAGLSLIFGLKLGPVVVISLVSFMATLSVLSGLKKGMRLLSLINMFLALVVFIAVFWQLDHAFYLEVLTKSFAGHILSLPTDLSFNYFKLNESWLSEWTYLYWAWWISWTPFVGLFIARISKGRKIEDFLFGVVVVPSLVSILWFSAFGSLAFLNHQAGLTNYQELLSSGPQDMLFSLLQISGLNFYLGAVSVLCIGVFYVTSSDSGSFVIDMITSGREDGGEATNKVFWSALEGLVAICLIYIGGKALVKDLVILFSFPVALFLCFSLWQVFKLLKKEL